MFNFLSSVTRNTVINKVALINSLPKRTLFVGVFKTNQPLDEVYNKYTHIPEINESYKKLLGNLIDENTKKLIDLGIKSANEETTLQLDSVWRKKAGKMTRQKHKKRRRANKNLIIQKNDMRKQRRANAEAKENYLLSNGLAFYKH